MDQGIMEENKDLSNQPQHKLRISYRTRIMIAVILSIAVTIFLMSEINPMPAAVIPTEDRSRCVITKPPIEYGFDPFYEKYCEMDGIPIISSPAVDDLALQQAHYILENLLAPIPYVREEMVDLGVYFAIIGRNENLTTLPEYVHMDSAYWDQRARGLGAGGKIRITSAAEENLLCLGSDKYFGESIAVHEFAHTIHLLGLRRTVFGFDFRLRLIYYLAKFEGLWEDTYAGSDLLEYWAEGVQTYFGTNLQSRPPDGVHNSVNTYEELQEYDPRLFNFIDNIYGGFYWEPTCPED